MYWNVRESNFLGNHMNCSAFLRRIRIGLVACALEPFCCLLLRETPSFRRPIDKTLSWKKKIGVKTPHLRFEPEWLGNPSLIPSTETETVWEEWQAFSLFVICIVLWICLRISFCPSQHLNSSPSIMHLVQPSLRGWGVCLSSFKSSIVTIFLGIYPWI